MELFRFLLVGLVNTVIGLSAMYGLLHLAGFSYWWATFGGNSIGAAVSYFLNRSFTFRSNHPVSSTGTRFVLVILICYVIAYPVGKGMAVQIIEAIQIVPANLTEDLAVLFGTGLYTILNYVGQKKVVFGK